MKTVPPLRSATILSLVRSADRDGLMQKALLQRVVWALDDNETVDLSQYVLDIAEDPYEELHEQWLEIAGKIKLHKHAVACAEAADA